MRGRSKRPDRINFNGFFFENIFLFLLKTLSLQYRGVLSKLKKCLLLFHHSLANSIPRTTHPPLPWFLVFFGVKLAPGRHYYGEEEEEEKRRRRRLRRGH